MKSSMSNQPGTSDTRNYDGQRQDTSPIGTGVQAILVGCGILLFAFGLILSFGTIGMTDLAGGFTDDADSTDGQTDVDGSAPTDDDDDQDGNDDTGTDDSDATTDPGDDDMTDEAPPGGSDDGGDDGTGDDAEPLSAEVTTYEPSSIDATSGEIHGELLDLGDAESVHVYFEWRDSDADAWNATDDEQVSSVGGFSRELSGMNDDTEYEYRAVAEMDTGEVVIGNTQTFTTEQSEQLAVETDTASDIDTSSATLHGELVNLGDDGRVTVYFEWRDDEDAAWRSTDELQLTSTGTFSFDLDRLDDETEYEFRAIVQSTGDADTGDIETFTTADEDNNGDDSDSDDGDDDDGLPF